MPKRHLVVLFLALIVASACYQVAARNRLASLLTNATDLMVNEGYYPVEEDQLLVSAMQGMLKNVDPFSEFQYGDRAIEREEHLNQAYAGLGIRIRRDPETRLIRIVKPMFGSPAEKAGLQAGDHIAKIDGTPVAQLPDSEDIEQRLKGPEGTTVDLEIQRPREGTDPQILKVTVQRQVIPTPSVVGDVPNQNGSWNFFLEEFPEIGYIRILQFGMRTSDELRTALQAIDGKVRYLILDLRENPGGLLPAAVEVSDQFIARPQEVIVNIKDRQGLLQESFVSTAGKTMSKDIPMVVLVNQNSASASEIVSACLQDHGVATVAGQRSFGKGTVQTQFSLPRPNALLTLTTASYWRPSGKNIHRLRWRSNSPTAPPDRLDKQDWGVSPDPSLAVPLNLRDSTVLAFLYENRYYGIPESDIDPAIKNALDRIGSGQAPSAIHPDLGVVRREDSDGTPPPDLDEETPPADAVLDTAIEESERVEQQQRIGNQIQWDDSRPLHYRDPQMLRVIEWLTGQTVDAEPEQP